MTKTQRTTIATVTAAVLAAVGLGLTVHLAHDTPEERIAELTNANRAGTDGEVTPTWQIEQRTERRMNREWVDWPYIDVDCPDDVTWTVGESFTCDATDFDVTVDMIDGQYRVNWTLLPNSTGEPMGSRW